DPRITLRTLDTREHLLLAQRNAELFVGPEDLRINLVKRLRAVLLFRRRVVIEFLVIDRAVLDPRPGGLAHGLPAAKRLTPPRQHPFRLVLLGRDEMDGVFAEPLRGPIGFDIGNEPVLVLMD